MLVCRTQQKVIDDIRKQYLGRRGRFKRQDMVKVYRAKANLQLIHNGLLPSEVRFSQWIRRRNRVFLALMSCRIFPAEIALTIASLTRTTVVRCPLRRRVL